MKYILGFRIRFYIRYCNDFEIKKNTIYILFIYLTKGQGMGFAHQKVK